MSIVPLFDKRLRRHKLCLTAAWSRSMCRWGFILAVDGSKALVDAMDAFCLSWCVRK